MTLIIGGKWGKIDKTPLIVAYLELNLGMSFESHSIDKHQDVDLGPIDFDLFFDGRKQVERSQLGTDGG
jgi:hypothetical protein